MLAARRELPAEPGVSSITAAICHSRFETNSQNSGAAHPDTTPRENGFKRNMKITKAQTFYDNFFSVTVHSLCDYFLSLNFFLSLQKKSRDESKTKSLRTSVGFVRQKKKNKHTEHNGIILPVWPTKFLRLLKKTTRKNKTKPKE